MRILVLNHEYPPVGGGGGKACQDIAFELADRGHEIKLLTSHFKGLPRDEDHPNLQIIRLPVLRQSLSRAGLVTMKVYILSSIFKGCQLMKSWKPDIIHVHFAVPAGAAALPRWWRRRAVARSGPSGMSGSRTGSVRVP